MFVTVLLLKYTLSISQWSYGHFLPSYRDRSLCDFTSPCVYIFAAITGTADSMRGRVSASVRRLFVRLSQPGPQQEITIYCCSATLSVYIVAVHRLVLTALSWRIWVIYVFLHLFPRRTFMALVLCPSGHPDNDGCQSTDGNTKH